MGCCFISDIWCCFILLIHPPTEKTGKEIGIQNIKSEMLPQDKYNAFEEIINNNLKYVIFPYNYNVILEICSNKAKKYGSVTYFCL